MQSLALFVLSVTLAGLASTAIDVPIATAAGPALEHYATTLQRVVTSDGTVRFAALKGDLLGLGAFLAGFGVFSPRLVAVLRSHWLRSPQPCAPCGSSMVKPARTSQMLSSRPARASACRRPSPVRKPCSRGRSS